MTESEANAILKAEIVHHPECSIFAEALGLAIQALEKQIPKKPIDRCMYKECPTCGNVEIEFCKHCPDCGQKIDRSDND